MLKIICESNLKVLINNFESFTQHLNTLIETEEVQSYFFGSPKDLYSKTDNRNLLYLRDAHNNILEFLIEKLEINNIDSNNINFPFLEFIVYKNKNSLKIEVNNYDILLISGSDEDDYFLNLDFFNEKNSLVYFNKPEKIIFNNKNKKYEIRLLFDKEN